MSFADPQTLTLNAVAQTLPRVSSSGASSTYSKDDGTVRMVVSHSLGKRNRRLLRVEHSKISADVFTAAQTRFNANVYVVVDAPVSGYTNAEIKQIVDALTAYLTASSGANVSKLLGGEH